MPSKEIFEILGNLGIDLVSDDGFRYNKYDSLATADDLASLFEIAHSVKDNSGRPVVFTPVAVVANPDFDKILQTDFIDYYFEPFTETLKRYRGCENSFSLWKEGIEKRLFVPQFHGREHLNVKVWMRALRSGHKRTRQAFENGMWGISTANDPAISIEFQAAFNFIDPEDLNLHKAIIISGLSLFNLLFGFSAIYFVPPNGPFNSNLEDTCFNNGIRLISVPKLQFEPVGEGKERKRIHWTGQKGRSGLIYLNRNCFFEPGIPDRDWVDSCLHDISTAFRWCKPAVISSHRVNYIGALDKRNRDNGLKTLLTLLKEIMKNWPDTEFVTTAELFEVIHNERNKTKNISS